MKTITRAFVLAVACLGAPALADTDQAVDYIVSQTITRDIFEGALAAQRPLIISALQNDLRQKGIELTDKERFFDLLMEEFMDEFTRSMQQQTGAVYHELFTDKQLEEIAAFYKTPSGQALISKTPTLMMEGARMGQIAGQQANEKAGERLGERIENEGLIVVEEPGMIDQLMDMLRR